MKIPTELIMLDPSAQSRTNIQWKLVGEYTEAMKQGDVFPPIVVFYDGNTYWLADGFHRTYAAKRINTPEMECDVRDGNLRNAILYSVSANSQHGLQRKAEDKRKAVIQLLNDPEWSQWSDREISQQCGVSHTFVSRLRPIDLPTSGNSESIVNRRCKRGVMRISKRSSPKIQLQACGSCVRLKTEILELQNKLTNTAENTLATLY